MTNEHIKQGRAREYLFHAADGFAHPEAAYFAAMLNEARARVYDLIDDLTPEQLSAVPEGLGNSIQMLVTHMTWGEYGWIGRATGEPLPAELGEARPAGAFPQLDRTAAQLIAESHAMRDLFTEPVLRRATDLDRVAEADPANARGAQAVSLRGALMHQVWHWTYHSGQVGLLRRFAGAKYRWAMTPRLVGRD